MGLVRNWERQCDSNDQMVMSMIPGERRLGYVFLVRVFGDAWGAGRAIRFSQARPRVRGLRSVDARFSLLRRFLGKLQSLAQTWTVIERVEG